MSARKYEMLTVSKILLDQVGKDNGGDKMAFKFLLNN